MTTEVQVTAPIATTPQAPVELAAGAVTQQAQTPPEKKEVLAPKYSLLARQQKALREEQRKFQEEKKSWEQEKAKLIDPSAFKSNALSVLAQHGVDYNALTQQALTQTDPTLQKIAQLEAKLAEFDGFKSD